MSIQVEDYFARDTFQKMKAFADKQETPFVLIDTQMISQAYDDLRAGFEFAKVYYAVKATLPSKSSTCSKRKVRASTSPRSTSWTR